MIAVVFAIGVWGLAAAATPDAPVGSSAPNLATRDSAASVPASVPSAVDSATVDSAVAHAAASADSSAPPATPAIPDTLRRAMVLDLRPPGGAPVEPVGIALDAFGRLYVSDLAGRRLLRLDAAGHPIGETGALGDDEGRLRRPGHVVTYGSLGVALLDEENRKILSYDLFGHVQGVRVDLVAQLEDRDGSRVKPMALASDQSGGLYVADADGDRVIVFDASGRLSRIITKFGSGPGALLGLAGVAVGRKGDLVVTESVEGRVQRLDPSGRPRVAWRLPVRSVSGRLPAAIDDGLRVAVADEDGGRVWLFDDAGRLIAEAGGFKSPAALAFARDGSLWVAERRSGRLVRLALGTRGGTP